MPRVAATDERDEVKVARAEVQAKKSEIELSAKRRRRPARKVRVATGQHPGSVGRKVGEKLVAERLEDGESVEGHWSQSRSIAFGQKRDCLAQNESRLMESLPGDDAGAYCFAWGTSRDLLSKARRAKA